MSVWENIDALNACTYHGADVNVFHQCQEWFETVNEATLVLWWVPAAHTPSIDEAIDRFERLRRRRHSHSGTGSIRPAATDKGARR